MVSGYGGSQALYVAAKLGLVEFYNGGSVGLNSIRFPSRRKGFAVIHARPPVQAHSVAHVPELSVHSAPHRLGIQVEHLADGDEAIRPGGIRVVEPRQRLAVG
jgi:hypothetical protein